MKRKRKRGEVTGRGRMNFRVFTENYKGIFQV